MRYIVIVLACVAVLCTGCGKVYTFHLGTESVGYSSNGGLQWMLPDGGPRYIVEHSTIALPVQAGNMVVLYESATNPGVFVSHIEWIVNGYVVGSSEPQRGFKVIPNQGTGTHRVQGVVYRRYVGDRRSAPTDTLEFRVKTYFPNYESGLRWIRPDGSTQITPGMTVNLPTSRGHLPMTFQVGEAMADNRYCSYVDYYVDGQLERRTEAPFTFTFANPGNGDHEVRCVAHFLRTDDRQSDGVHETTFTVRTWKDVY